jgi:hypothetical protein
MSVALLSAAMLIVAIALLEGLLALRTGGGDDFSTRAPDDWIEIDEHGLERTRPDRVYRLEERVSATGELVFDVELSTDEFGRRQTPADAREQRDRFLLFFGGSYVQGWGLEDEETLPAQFAKRAPHWMPYNYALHEHGAAELLAKLDSGTLPDEVPERKGALVYVSTRPDRDRAAGSMRVVSTARGPVRPHYFVTEDGSVERRGSFASGRPLRTPLYRLLGRSRLLGLAGIDLRPGSSEDGYRLVAAILATARDRFEEQFPDQTFAVMIFPDNSRGPELVPHLERLGVKTLDWSADGALPDELTLGKGDWHPNAAANAMLAERLIRELDLR